MSTQKPGRKPFGKHPLRPEETATLARLRSLNRVVPESRWKIRNGVLETRRSFHEIARLMNKDKEKYPTRTGRPWSAKTVIKHLGPSRKRYSRHEAIKKGKLKDVSAAARDEGITSSVAITAKAWETLMVHSAMHSKQILSGDLRLTRLLYKLRRSIADHSPRDITWLFEPLLDRWGGKPATLRCVARGLSDTHTPVITVMLPQETRPLLFGLPGTDT